MPTVRSQLVDLLTARLPQTWEVRAGLGGLDNLTVPTVAVWTHELEPGPARGLRTHTLRVRLLSPLSDPDQVEDALEVDVALLCAAIESLDPITWSTAERGIHADTYHAYTLTVSVPVRKDTTT